MQVQLNNCIHDVVCHSIYVRKKEKKEEGKRKGKKETKKEKGRKKNRKKKMIHAGDICSYSAGESTDVGMYPDNTLELND